VLTVFRNKMYYCAVGTAAAYFEYKNKFQFLKHENN